VATPQRKYQTAAGLSPASEQRLVQLEQRFQQLDDELAAVEAAIEQRFPLLGLGTRESDLDMESVSTNSVRKTARTRPKPR